MSTEEGKDQAKKAFMRETVAAVLKKAILDMLPPDSDIKPEELEAFTQIGLMAAATLGTEDPHALFSKVPDRLLTHMASRGQEAQRRNPAVKNICQLALLEWCGRRGHLNGDWVWKWETKNRGQAYFIANIPLEEALRLLMEELRADVPKQGPSDTGSGSGFHVVEVPQEPKELPVRESALAPGVPHMDDGLSGGHAGGAEAQGERSDES